MNNPEYQRARYKRLKAEKVAKRLAEGGPPLRPYLHARWTEENLTEPWAMFHARKKAEREARRRGS